MTEEAEAASPPSIAVGHLSDRPSSAEIKSDGIDAAALLNTKEATAVTAIDTINDAIDDDGCNRNTLPESTHTLLFTEPINSRAFQFSFAIAALSILCLLLALLSNDYVKFGSSALPANVGGAVKAAQYASIFIALVMEEEIPTGLFLLRRISKKYFKSHFSGLKYYKFVASCVLRIIMGYLFLVNVLLTLVQASDVLDIFFDFIALQFLQQLDDIAFNLAKMGLFSKRLRVATTNKYFRVELTKEVNKAERSRRISFFLRTIYFMNLIALLAMQIHVTIKQSKGDYQCKSITVIIKDEVWEESIVKVPGKGIEKMVLIYSYFNGVYNQNGSSNDNRPIYVEQNKFDNTPFDAISIDPEIIPVKIPAEIKYCKSIRAWVFMHEHIRKSTHDDSDCPWLLRSEETDVYDIEEVKGPWQVWAGVISRTDVTIVCNECHDNADCNLNGICMDDGKCECYNGDKSRGVTFMGAHCEVRLKDDCRTIYSEMYNESWGVVPVDWGEQGLWQEYDRPVYLHYGGNPFINDADVAVLIYSGDRWFGVYQPRGKVLFQDFSIFKAAVTNYHAFWDEALTSGTILVSDPTTKDTPVGVDFYLIGERGDQFGPYGALYPLQLSNQTGRGVFRCTDTVPYVYPYQNFTGPGQRTLQTEGLFDKYLWLAGAN